MNVSTGNGTTPTSGTGVVCECGCCKVEPNTRGRVGRVGGRKGSDVEGRVWVVRRVKRENKYVKLVSFVCLLV
jgi:hypothetical protein